MSQTAQKLYTPAEYLALEETAKYKSEYYRGKIYAMAGASLNHNRITRNLTGLLFAALGGRNCEAFAGDMRLLIEVEGLYTYPDVMVVCGNPVLAPNSDSTITNPLVIFEVLSDSTSEYDRTDKFELYKKVPTLQNYVLVDQHRAYIQCYRRGEGRIWLVESYNLLDENLNLPALDIELSLKAIYERVEWPAPSSTHPEQSN